MDDLKIDKNVPLLKKMHLRRKKAKFDSVLEKMEIGDSILFNDKKEARNFVNFAIRRGFRVAQRKENLNGDVRVWLTDVWNEGDKTLSEILEENKSKFCIRGKSW